MSDNEELLNELFAYRIQYMDITINEQQIIRRLKNKLLDLGYAMEDLNSILFSFYNYFDINMSLSEIENVNIDDNVVFIMNDNLPLLPNLLNLLLGYSNISFEQVLVEPSNTMNDIVVTTDENSLNNFTILKISNQQNEKCAICMIEMNEDEEYLDIECKHIFHKECLETYLKNYNHICPVCRKDIGVSHPNF